MKRPNLFNEIYGQYHGLVRVASDEDFSKIKQDFDIYYNIQGYDDMDNLNFNQNKIEF